jgi:hypothetical protein
MSYFCCISVIFHHYPESFSFPELNEVKRLYPECYHGVDRLGRSVYIQQLGKLDIKGLVKGSVSHYTV